MGHAEAWTARDSVLYATCEIFVAAVNGRLKERSIPAHTFAPQFSLDEQVLAAGEYDLAWWGAVGNGSYERHTFIAGGSGALGVGLLGATALGSAIGNASRRNQAALDSTGMWRLVERGIVNISDRGVYLQSPVSFRPFAWSHIMQADLAAQTVLQFVVQTSSGVEHLALTSDWAELVFVLWALAVHRNHPRLVTTSWIDPEFFDKCRDHGYAPPRPALGA